MTFNGQVISVELVKGQRICKARFPLLVCPNDEIKFASNELVLGDEVSLELECTTRGKAAVARG